MKIFGIQIGKKKEIEIKAFCYGSYVEPKFKIEQTIFCGEFKTYVWFKSQLVKMYSLEITTTQQKIDNDLDKAKQLVIELEKLKF